MQRRRQDFESEGAKLWPGKKVRGTIKRQNMQNYVTFLFTGYFAFFKNWSIFEMAEILHVFLNFELIFYHNYFTGLLVLPNNFGKFSAFWCKNILKYNLHLLRNVCFYKRHMFTRWERKQSYLLNFEVYTHCKIILGERGRCGNFGWARNTRAKNLFI